MVQRLRQSWLRGLVGLGLGAASVWALGAGWARTPTATAPTAGASAVQRQGAAEIATIRTYSNLVVVDVVVTDPRGHAVHGLNKDAFSLTENGKPQTIRNFEEHSASPTSGTQFIPAPKMPPGLFSNRSAAPANGPVNVLLLDYLNTPAAYQPYARKQLLDYLNKAPAGTRIAIFALTDNLLMLQGFTSDMQQLKVALTSKEGAPQVSDILPDGFSGGPEQDKTISMSMATLSTEAQASAMGADVADAIERFEALQTSFELDVRAGLTLSAFDSLARYLVGIPGRKNVIWFSGSFPLNVEPNANEEDPNDSVVRNDDAVRRTDNLLTRAQVAVYPVDPRGVMTDPSQGVSSSAPNALDEAAATPPSDCEKVAGNNPLLCAGQVAANDNAEFLTDTAQEHETMEAMAEDTGGKPFYNTNDLTQAVTKAIDNGSNYYTLTYSPSNTVWDARFRSIKVKLDQPGVKLTYRNGYYAVDPDDRKKLNAQGAATALTDRATMTTAMLHGGPDPAEILFKVRIRPSATPPENAVLKSDQSNPDPKVKIEGPFKSYGLDLVPDPHAVSCNQEANGNRHCALEIWTFVYNSNGDKLITASNRVRTMMTPADYEKLLTGGMAFHQEISVPVKGKYFIRTAIHDLVSDRVGAVEIPVAAVARLAPLDQVAASAGSAAAGASPEPANAPGH